ncbi:MAG: helix-turn-helix transcriptional regulator [bacterium]
MKTPTHYTNLADLRNAKKWTQGELATKSGIGRSTVNFIEKGTQSMSDEQRRRLAGALDINPTDITREKLSFPLNAKELLQAAHFPVERILAFFEKNRKLRKGLTIAGLVKIAASISFKQRKMTGSVLDDGRFDEVVRDELATMFDTRK